MPLRNILSFNDRYTWRLVIDDSFRYEDGSEWHLNEIQKLLESKSDLQIDFKC